MKQSNASKSGHFQGLGKQLITAGTLIGVLTISSCGSKTKPHSESTARDSLSAQRFDVDPLGAEKVDSIGFNVQKMADSVRAFKGEPRSPKGVIRLRFPIAVGSSDKGSFVNKEIKKRLTDQSDIPGGALMEVAETVMKQYLSGYKTDMAFMLKNAPDSKDSAGNYSPSLNFVSNRDISVIYNAHDYVVLQEDVYDYAGGAHGNYGSLYNCLDINNRRQLGLRDILSVDSATLQPIVEKYFREQYELKPNEPLNKILFDDHLPANNNFYVNDTGIGFIYNPYEVAAYAGGKIEVFIPYEAVETYLNPDFAKRVGIKGK